MYKRARPRIPFRDCEGCSGPILVLFFSLDLYCPQLSKSVFRIFLSQKLRKLQPCEAVMPFWLSGGGGQVVRALLLIKSIIILPPDPLSEVPCGSLSLGKSLELSNLLLKKLNLIENFNFTLN